MIYLRLSTYYYLPIKKQLQRIIKMNPEVFNSSNRPVHYYTDFIEDVNDGEIYKELYKSELGYCFEKNEAFTFSLNTDGISICDESNVTIWPIILVCNEIPKERRFCLDNIIIAGSS